VVVIVSSFPGTPNARRARSTQSAPKRSPVFLIVKGAPVRTWKRIFVR
jgi:hypothetical protein